LFDFGRFGLNFPEGLLCISSSSVELMLSDAELVDWNSESAKMMEKGSYQAHHHQDQFFFKGRELVPGGKMRMCFTASNVAVLTTAT
jgi:hypothetical protein